MAEFITIASFTYPSEIVVLKSILEYEGIAHFFQNETIISVDPLASLAYGGIQLKIHPKDITVVQNILNNLNNNSELKIVK